jgi:hypothetical protein
MVDELLTQRDFVLSVFLDVEGCFDNTPFESMRVAASEHGVRPTILTT